MGQRRGGRRGCETNPSPPSPLSHRGERGSQNRMWGAVVRLVSCSPSPLLWERGLAPSNRDGGGITDEPTLKLALLAASRVAHDLLEGLLATALRGAVGNALTAHPAGILQGVDHQRTGKIERVDTALLQALLA